jgi:hypothetical protein
LRDKASLRNIAPEKPVRIGAKNLMTTASDSDRCFKEKNNPEIEMNL